MEGHRILLDDYLEKHPFSVSQALQALDLEAVVEFLGKLPAEKRLALLELMNTHEAVRFIALMPHAHTRELLEQGDFSFAERILRELDPRIAEELLGGLSAERSTVLRNKLRQEPNTVGVYMVPAIVVNKEMTVKGAIEILRSNHENLETYLYVVDLTGIFQGAVRLKELLWAEKSMTLEALMIQAIPQFYPDTPIHEVLNHPAWYEYRYIPVISRENKLLGTLPYSTTREVTPKGGNPSSRHIVETGGALGELYLIGLTGLLQSVGK